MCQGPDSRRMTLCLLAVTVIFSFCGLSLFAQTEEEESTAYRRQLDQLIKEVEGEFKNELDASFKFIPSSGAKELSGSLTIIDSAAEYSYNLKALDKIPVEVSLKTEYIGIENSTEVELPAHMTGLALGADVTLPLFTIDKAYLRVGVFPSYYTEKWNFYSSSFRIPSTYLAIYQPNEKLTLVLGVGVFPDFETKVIPIGGIIYKPNDKLSFNLVPTRPTITYELNNKITLFGEGNYSYGEYEVKKGNLNRVILAYKEKYLGLGVVYTFNKYIQVSLAGGASFGRVLKYRDSLGKVNIKDNMYTEFRLEMQI